MKHKNVLFVAGAIIVLGAIVGVGIALWKGESTQHVTPRPEFVSDEIGIRFTYPDVYHPTVRRDSFKGAEIHVVTLIDASTTVPDMSEGPTAISLIQVPVPPATSLETWVRGASISNFNLSPDQVFIPTKVGGEAALAYRHSGLYEFDAVAVKHGNTIYLFSASWMNQEDRIRSDFKDVLSSVTFSK